MRWLAPGRDDVGVGVSGSSDNTVRVWNVLTEAAVVALEGHTGAVTSVSWSPDRTRLASGSSDTTTVRVWEEALK